MSYKSFFEAHLRKVRWLRNGQGMALCPFHDDHNPSLSLEAEKGLWYCHSCRVGGTVYKFAKMLGVPVPQKK
jgi:putative DNA primase/helicase